MYIHFLKLHLLKKHFPKYLVAFFPSSTALARAANRFSNVLKAAHSCLVPECDQGFLKAQELQQTQALAREQQRRAVMLCVSAC